jgi:mono/diheme cytochrome c family protein
MLAASCSKSVPANSNAVKKVYNSTGVIKAIDVNTNKVTIDHKDIPGFMSAMEMTFPAENASVFDGFAVGDTVAFVLEKSGGKVSLVNMTKAAVTGPGANGERLFASNCAECHGAKGEGAKKGIPLISGHALAHSEEEYVQQVLNGKADKMPAFRDKLSDEQIDAIIKFVRTVIQADVKPEERKPHPH